MYTNRDNYIQTKILYVLNKTKPSFRLKDKRIIVAVEGKNRNIIYILPPLCFSQQNAKIFIEQLDVVISELGEEILEGKVMKEYKSGLELRMIFFDIVLVLI